MSPEGLGPALAIVVGIAALLLLVGFVVAALRDREPPTPPSA